MKIIVIDSANVRIEILEVADYMLENNDIKQFLAEHDYSLNNISWMAAPIDFVPVQFHDYSVEDGVEVHTQRDTQIKNMSVYDEREQLKARERRELREALKKYGKKLEHGYRWEPEEDDGVCVGAYFADKPCDADILSVEMDENEYLTIMGRETEYSEEYEVDIDDIYTGHVDWITDAIKRSAKK